MIRVIVNEQALEDESEFAYDMNAELQLPDDATAEQALHMFIRALNISGYADVSIRRSIINYADDIRREFPNEYPGETEE